MPLKLSVGVSRKVGRPGYGSLGAACGVEVELDQALLRDDPAEFDRRARPAYAACARAVDAELARLAAPGPDADQVDRPDGRARGLLPRPATPRQLRALAAIARARGETLDDLLAEGGSAGPAALSAAEASRLIAGLRAAAAG
jgi:hypothetical protein